MKLIGIPSMPLAIGRRLTFAVLCTVLLAEPAFGAAQAKQSKAMSAKTEQQAKNDTGQQIQKERPFSFTGKLGIFRKIALKGDESLLLYDIYDTLKTGKGVDVFDVAAKTKGKPVAEVYLVKEGISILNNPIHVPSDSNGTIISGKNCTYLVKIIGATRGDIRNSKESELLISVTEVR